MADSTTSPANSLNERIESLQTLCRDYLKCENASERVQLLDSLPIVKRFVEERPWLNEILFKMPTEAKLILQSLIAIGQGPIVLRPPKESSAIRPALEQLVEKLKPVESFYQSLGGLLGYHLTVLKLVRGDALSSNMDPTRARYVHPKGIDLRQDSPKRRRAVLEGLEKMPLMAEIYAVGGAGDRLGLFDERTGEPLPAAMLRLGGAGCLLEWLIRDLQAREYLHYRLYGTRIITPIAMMTSQEKNNHQHILRLCEEHNWFGRPHDSFRLFCQPLVPVVTATGDWATEGAMQPVFKPGGHGVIWKLAEEQGVFDWLKNQHRRKALVRQINNPISGLDDSLLAFTGLGLMGDKSFGFASCERRLNAPEGMNVLIETNVDHDYEYRLTNIEYTEFTKYGIQDLPSEPESPYSAFAANTNILFVDLEAVRQAIQRCPVPGMLINMKTKAPHHDELGRRSEIAAGRLEGTMQNIADCIVDHYDQPLSPDEQENLKTYITYGARHKTLAVVKENSSGQKSKLGTPENCYYELLHNYHELLVGQCGMTLPALVSFEAFLESPPPFLLQLHPALGPPFSLIRQKIRGGVMASGSHLVLQLADADITQLRLAGSLQVIADDPMGDCSSRCTLRRVAVENKGIDLVATKRYWQGEIACTESLIIRLCGNSEFLAEDVIFTGSHLIEVADGERVVAEMDSQGFVKLSRMPLKNPWSWRYAIDPQDQITLTKQT